MKRPIQDDQIETIKQIEDEVIRELHHDGLKTAFKNYLLALTLAAGDPDKLSQAKQAFEREKALVRAFNHVLHTSTEASFEARIDRS